MPWFPFDSFPNGLQSAQVRARLQLDTFTSRKIDFLVDSGASRSLVPSLYVTGAMLQAAPNQDVSLGLQDAHGNWIRGKLINFRVHLIGAPNLPSTEETFGVSEKVCWPVLGLTWFKKFGVHFRNFDSHWRGPGFALYVDRPRVNPGG